jgi:hypothetical protein
MFPPFVLVEPLGRVSTFTCAAPPRHLLHSPARVFEPFTRLLMDPQSLDTENLLKGAVRLIHDLIPKALQRPRVAVVCGSGLSTLGATIRGRVDLPYTSIPGFTSSTGVYRSSLRVEPNSYSGSGRPRERIGIWIPWNGSRCPGSGHAWTGIVSLLLARSIA